MLKLSLLTTCTSCTCCTYYTLLVRVSRTAHTALQLWWCHSSRRSSSSLNLLLLLLLLLFQFVRSHTDSSNIRVWFVQTCGMPSAVAPARPVYCFCSNQMHSWKQMCARYCQKEHISQLFYHAPPPLPLLCLFRKLHTFAQIRLVFRKNKSILCLRTEKVLPCSRRNAYIYCGCIEGK